jgi:glycosyltransferase involved in cell wall biosynthesis
MAAPNRLIIGRTGELPHWQETFLGTVAERLPFAIERWDVVSPEALTRVVAKRTENAVLWLWSGRWRAALRRLRRWTSPVVVPVFELGLTVAPSWPWRWFVDGKTYVGASTQLVPTTAFAARFLQEIEGVPAAQVSVIPVPAAPTPHAQRRSDGTIRVGTFLSFLPSSNVPFFLAAAHYVAARRPDVRFTVAGYGPLESHLRRMIHELELDAVVRIEATDSADVMDGFDVFFYAPDRCDHLGPMELAAVRGLPCIVSEPAAMESKARDGHECLVVPTNESGIAGELILRTIESATLRRGLGQQLRAHVAARNATETAVKCWTELFRGLGVEPSDRRDVRSNLRRTGAAA